jgi:hypothetical protein
MERFKPYLDVIAGIAGIFTIIASGIAIYVFIFNRQKISAAIGLLLNYSFQTTLSELKEKLERLNEYNANDSTENQEIRNILHEIAGQLRGNNRLSSRLFNMSEKIETLASSKKLTEPTKRSLISELREQLRNIQMESIDNFSGKNDE